MLSNPKLAEHYGVVTWLFTSRNFKDDAVDREALRTHDRFGVSSWPQILLFDPRDDQPLQWLPRDFDGFVRGLQQHAEAVPEPAAADLQAAERFAQATAGKTPDRKVLGELAAAHDGIGVWLAARERLRRDGERPLAEQLVDPDDRERCLALERIAALPAAAAAGLRQETLARLADPAEALVVRLRALRVMTRDAPEAVTERAAALLAVPNDPFRYAVLDVVENHPDPQLGPALATLFADAGSKVPSQNPNVLRIHVAKCLATSGDRTAIAPLGAVTRKAQANNGLTGAAIDALVALAPRLTPADRAAVVAELAASFPPALEDSGLEDFGERGPRMLLALGQRVHTALAGLERRKLPALPKQWTRATRDAFMADLHQALKD